MMNTDSRPPQLTRAAGAGIGSARSVDDQAEEFT
jgi:hypothetical protein